MLKYQFQVRNRNGVIVSNLLIAAKTEDDAKRKLFQMYPHSEILSMTHVISQQTNTANFEEVLNLIVNYA